MFCFVCWLYVRPRSRARPATEYINGLWRGTFSKYSSGSQPAIMQPHGLLVLPVSLHAFCKSTELMKLSHTSIVRHGWHCQFSWPTFFSVFLLTTIPTSRIKVIWRYHRLVACNSPIECPVQRIACRSVIYEWRLFKRKEGRKKRKEKKALVKWPRSSVYWNGRLRGLNDIHIHICQIFQ